MRRGGRPFTVHETHGILWRSEHKIEASSDRLRWASLYLSMQREQPYQGSYLAAKDHLIIVHRDGPVRVRRQLSGDCVERVVQPGGLFVMPAQRDFGVQLGGSLSTIHVYVRASFVQEAAADLARGDSERVELIPRLGVHDAMIDDPRRFGAHRLSVAPLGRKMGRVVLN
jgi:AraC family transcriptional regulator